MNKKVLKTISILCLIFAVLFAFTTPVLANYTSFDTMDVTQVKGSDSSGASASIGRIAEGILNMVQIVAMFTAVIMLIVLAIKYISSAPNDKAEIKKHAVVYVVGAIVLFSATGLLQIIKQFATNTVKPA